MGAWEWIFEQAAILVKALGLLCNSLLGACNLDVAFRRIMLRARILDLRLRIFTWGLSGSLAHPAISFRDPWSSTFFFFLSVRVKGYPKLTITPINAGKLIVSLEVNFSLLVISVQEFSSLSLLLSLCCPAGCHLLEEVSGMTISDSFAFEFRIFSLWGLQRDF